MTLPADLATSLDITKQALVDANTDSSEAAFDDASTVQKVIAGLSQMAPTSHSQNIFSVDKTTEDKAEDILGAVFEGLSTMSTSAPDHGNASPILGDQLETPVEAAPNWTPAFAAWVERVSENKKRRTDSTSSWSSLSVTAPKRRRLFGLGNEMKLAGSVKNPILLPLFDDTPFLEALPTSSLSPEPAKQKEIRRKKEKVPKFEYEGIHSLLDCEGCPAPFPHQVQELVERQLKQHRNTGISAKAFDESFAMSMVNDGRGKIGARMFSSTGANNRMVAATSVPEAAEAFLVKLSNTELVFGTDRVLEVILLKLGEVETRGTVLRARGVNKAFERVIRRSTKVRKMLSTKKGFLNRQHCEAVK